MKLLDAFASQTLPSTSSIRSRYFIYYNNKREKTKILKTNKQRSIHRSTDHSIIVLAIPFVHCIEEPLRIARSAGIVIVRGDEIEAHGLKFPLPLLACLVLDGFRVLNDLLLLLGPRHEFHGLAHELVAELADACNHHDRMDEVQVLRSERTLQSAVVLTYDQIARWSNDTCEFLEHAVEIRHVVKSDETGDEIHALISWREKRRALHRESSAAYLGRSMLDRNRSRRR